MPVDVLGDFFRASGKFLAPQDPLARYCNVPMHWACYAAWPERPRFAGHYVAAWVAANQKNPFWWKAYEDEQVYVSVNPQPPVEEASVRLCAVGSDIRLPLPQWPTWLAKPECVTPGLCDLEQSTLAAVLPTLRARFPDDHALVHAIDPAEKQPAGRRRRRTSARAD
ncbi:MAG: hypothetical protein PHQ28_14175 [Mycobacterium sp.]|nr:hypothetical protein [Mycobacterium sp.]